VHIDEGLDAGAERAAEIARRTSRGSARRSVSTRRRGCLSYSTLRVRAAGRALDRVLGDRAFAAELHEHRAQVRRRRSRLPWPLLLAAAASSTLLMLGVWFAAAGSAPIEFEPMPGHQREPSIGVLGLDHGAP
jgi:hypothetical protein